MQGPRSAPAVLKTSTRYPHRDETLPHLCLADGPITPTRLSKGGTLRELARGGVSLKWSQAIGGDTNMQLSNKLGGPL